MYNCFKWVIIYLQKYLMAIRLFSKTKKDVSIPNLGVYNPYGTLTFGKKNALENSAFWACLMNLSRTFASLPLHILSYDKKNVNLSKIYYSKLFKNPCPYMNAYTWRFIMAFNFELYGRAYALITRNTNGDVESLFPLSPNAVSMAFCDNRPIYFVYGKEFNDSDILRIDNTPNGITEAFAPLDYTDRDIAFAKNAQSMASSYYDKSSFITRLLQYPYNIPNEAFEKLSVALKNTIGLDKAFGYSLLPDNIKYTPMQFTELDTDKMVKAQSWSVDEVARRFGVPPFFIGDLTKATYANTEQQGMQLTTYSILPRAKAWECAIDGIIDASLYSKFSLQGLMRADHATRSSFYHNGILDGYLSVNDVRAMEDMEPLSDEDGGNKHWFPLNYTTLDKAGESATNSTFPFDFTSQKQNESVKLKTINEKDRIDEKVKFYEERSVNAGRTTRVELERLFRTWVRNEFALIENCNSTEEAIVLLKEYIQENKVDYTDRVKRVLEPLLLSLLDTLKKTINSTDETSDSWKKDTISKYATNIVDRHFGEEESKLREYDDIETAKNEVLEYIPTRTEDEANRMRNAFALESFVAYQITEMKIVNSANACEFCCGFENRVLEVNKTIVNKGDKANDSAGNTYTITKSKKHPPLHSHCTCTIAPFVKGGIK